MVAMKTYVAARRKIKLTTLSCLLKARRANQATARILRIVFTKLHLKKCTRSSTKKSISALPVAHGMSQLKTLSNGWDTPARFEHQARTSQLKLALLMAMMESAAARLVNQAGKLRSDIMIFYLRSYDANQAGGLPPVS